ncbi:hypothetical protein HETIRDRAFT_325003 [Heterobasidion irregulare TC 32-1]|uniref:DUF6534 domain-containing protein n=1 Tax=Heterobasidion irregulare (strain TC 32-1) TaxID=747525 RepID=W4JYY3_HETIT|nr:uncharacterized protein HETIRDRAFT_325003 [Heterobasidion irregulare TC 32-1]ETW78091.1 hypothetical protein HETIRDRAFT_325003 [Heterobasidion irregulare TC 32-1]
MCYMFKTRQTGMDRTDSMLYRLIVFAASRGLIMSCIRVVLTGDIRQFFVYNDKLYWAVFHFMLGKLCSNSVLASLNIRDFMRGDDSSNYSGSNSIALSPAFALRSGFGFRKVTACFVLCCNAPIRTDTHLVASLT